MDDEEAWRPDGRELTYARQYHPPAIFDILM
jgi:hypothetical protein